MTALSFRQAREIVVQKLREQVAPPTEQTPLVEALGRVLAADVKADRDFPPVARSIRDGFAVRSCDLPGSLEVTGEIRAGEGVHQRVGPGQAIEIMTGAPLPEGADAVVMVEHVVREGKHIHVSRAPQPGQFVNPAGAEAKAGSIVVARGERLTFPRIAMLAAVGQVEVPVFRKPHIAILPTGDEVVPVESNPEPFQVRNSNAYSLAAQVSRCGGLPHLVGVARDEYHHTKACIEQGLESDLLLLSGGVSAGKYDLVETVLAGLGAEFFFTRVAIQPGQPLVFGRARGTFFFGLPGNPASTMVTFEIFARAAVEILAGVATPSLPLTYASLTRDFQHKTGLTRFLPAWLDPEGLRVTPIPWQGSSDLPALARSNCFLVADSEQAHWACGDLIPVLLP
ncbi:MAG: molybdopterin molybdotransferase MoeA [Bryobacteraceae bacterium]|nr:molybdopterin molybdotransferase MoeA [Bryobacteraceae bacterium]MDW8377211.1 molybdopterin molybdotransferase MoeA [Bryobacterales bacterium]